MTQFELLYSDLIFEMMDVCVCAAVLLQTGPRSLCGDGQTKKDLQHQSQEAALAQDGATGKEHFDKDGFKTLKRDIAL